MLQNKVENLLKSGTAAMQAIHRGHKNILQVLIDGKADINCDEAQKLDDKSDAKHACYEIIRRIKARQDRTRGTQNCKDYKGDGKAKG